MPIDVARRCLVGLSFRDGYRHRPTTTPAAGTDTRHITDLPGCIAMSLTPSVDHVEDTEEWVRRCHRRLSELRPKLVHLELTSMSEDMGRRAHWRRMTPEAAAEEAVDPPQARQPRALD